jgi:hypothetical protein
LYFVQEVVLFFVRRYSRFFSIHSRSVCLVFDGNFRRHQVSDPYLKSVVGLRKAIVLEQQGRKSLMAFQRYSRDW